MSAITKDKQFRNPLLSRSIHIGEEVHAVKDDFTSVEGILLKVELSGVKQIAVIQDSAGKLHEVPLTRIQ